MNSTAKYSYSDLLTDLDSAIELLKRGVAGLNAGYKKSSKHRRGYDNYPLTIGLAIEHIICRIRMSCIKDDEASPFAFFCIRTLQELCIKVASVIFLEAELNLKQKKGYYSAPN